MIKADALYYCRFVDSMFQCKKHLPTGINKKELWTLVCQDARKFLESRELLRYAPDTHLLQVVRDMEQPTENAYTSQKIWEDYSTQSASGTGLGGTFSHDKHSTCVFATESIKIEAHRVGWSAEVGLDVGLCFGFHRLLGFQDLLHGHVLVGAAGGLHLVLVFVLGSLALLLNGCM